MTKELYGGGWRSCPPPLDLALSDLGHFLPHVLQSGGTGLVWPRIRYRADEYGAAGEMLARTYQLYQDNLNAVEQDIALLMPSMAAAGIEAVLVKGWSLSRLYALPQVRRPGDIDLIVPNGSFAKAERIIAQAYEDGMRTSVDLKDDGMWKAMPSPDFRHRLVKISCGDSHVNVLGPTDALRHVCLHFMRHLGNRVPNTSPIWLCDIGALVETTGSEIDWDMLLTGDTVAVNRVRMALALSRDIVGLDPACLPDEIASIQLPDWAHESIYELWMEPHMPLRTGMQTHGVRHTLTKRFWPSPLNAVLSRNAPLGVKNPRRYQIEVSAHLIALYGIRVLTGGMFGK